MLKRLCATACFLVIALLFGCTGATPPASQEPIDPPAAEEEDYTSLDCRDYARFHTLSFGKDSGGYALSLSLPEEWEKRPDDGGIGFYLEGEEVARIEAASAIDNAFTRVDGAYFAGDGFDIDVLVEKKGTGADTVYRRVIRFWYRENDRDCALTLTARYTALSDAGVAQVINDAALQPVAAHTMLALGEKEPIRLLILGNSFIYTSQVGRILEAMCAMDERAVTVTAVSRGYARVSTYVTDADLMADIRAGDYDVVLQCGFYDTEQKTYLADMKAACDASGTALAIFPAHNENASALAAVRAAYPDLLYLDWKGQVQAFIDGGASVWDFCIDDSHKHSTQVAGYVGAHMIYRALFGQAPSDLVPIQLGGEWLKEERVLAILGEEFLAVSHYTVKEDFWQLP